MKKISYPVMVFMLLATLSGCAQKGPILLDMRYIAPEGTAAAARKVVVGVSPFKDDRAKPASVLGRRITSSGLVNDFVTQGTASELVAAKLKDALQARGVTVKDVAAWDMTAEGIKAEGVDILIAGEIKTLWVESESAVLNTKVVAEARLRVSAADVKDRKILRALLLTSKLERTDFSFSITTVEDTLSSALSSAIDQFMNDEELKNKIQ